MDKYNTVKLILSGMIAGVSSKLGILGPMLRGKKLQNKRGI